MRKIDEVIENIKYGCVLTIMKYNSFKEDSYNACITEYDGRILMDVKEVEIGNFLEQIPNIESKINGSNYYQLKYDFEKQVYQSAIMHKVRNDGYKEPFVAEILDNLVTENINVVEGMLDLDTKIADIRNENIAKKNLKKELAS